MVKDKLYIEVFDWVDFISWIFKFAFLYAVVFIFLGFNWVLVDYVIYKHITNITDLFHLYNIIIIISLLINEAHNNNELKRIYVKKEGA